MSTIKINDIQPEMGDLTEAQTEKVNGGDNPGMATPGDYEAGVAAYCQGLTTSMNDFVDFNLYS
jgi:hypothetical protein